MSVHGANIKRFIDNWRYRRCVIERLHRKRQQSVTKYDPTGLANRSVTDYTGRYSVESLKVRRPILKGWEEDEKWQGDNIGHRDIHYYEFDIVNAFKILLAHHPSASRLTRFHFNPCFHDFDIKLDSNSGGDGWFYLVNIWMTVDGKTCTLTLINSAISHCEGDFYESQHRIVSYNGVQLCDMSAVDFNSL